MSDSTDASSSSNQRFGWIRRHPIISAGLAFILTLLLFVAIADYGAGRSLDHQVQRIHVRGEPISVQDLRAAEHPPSPGDNLTAGLLNAVQPFVSLKPPEETLKLIQYLGGAASIPTGQRLPSEQIEAGEWYLDQHPDALAAMHEACKRPARWFDFRWSTPLLRIQLPDLSTLRHASKILALHARLSAEQNNPNKAGHRLLDCYRCAGFMDGNRYCVLVGSLVRIATASLAMDTTERIINRVQLDDEDLKRIQSEVLRWCQARGWAESMVVERAGFVDLLRVTRSGTLSNRGMTLVPVLRYADERAGVNALTELIDALRVPEPKTMDAVRTWRKRPPFPSYCLMSNSLLPSLDHSVNLSFRSAAEARALSASIACERYRIARDQWPHTLAELVPKYLEDVPADPFDGKPIRYSAIPEGIKLWSIGEDEKDDGGDVRRLEPYDRKNPRKDAGWVILNPDRRGK